MSAVGKSGHESGHCETDAIDPELPSSDSPGADILERSSRALWHATYFYSLAAEPRVGRRTALTFPLFPPPQKNVSLPFDFNPDTISPGGMSSCSRTSPLCGSIRRRSLCSPSQVPCQSSPSTQVTPVTKRFELDGAQNLAGLGIDLMDLALAMLRDPERCFGPRHSGGAAFRCRDGRDYAAGIRIDLLDAIPGDLVQVPAIEGGSGMRWDIERAHRFTACRVHRVQRVASRDPDIGAVIADPGHIRDIRKEAVFADDCRC